MQHSKSHTPNGSQSSKNPLFYWNFEALKTEYFSKFSPSILSFFRGLILRYSWSGIEVVITGLTRNQLRGNPPWVRIPPAPPKMGSAACASHFLIGKYGIRSLEPSARWAHQTAQGRLLSKGAKAQRGAQAEDASFAKGIPPAPPRKASKPNGFWLFFLFALTRELLRCTFGSNSLLDAASSNSQTAEQCICR